MGIAIGFKAFLIFLALLAAAVALFFFKRQPAVLSFSSLQILKQHVSLRLTWFKLPAFCRFTTLALLLTAFLDPYIIKTHPEMPTEGIAIYLVLDRSSSMNAEITAVSTNKVERIKKIDLLRQLTTQFIEGNSKAHLPGRYNDLIGLVTFARTAQVAAPLTLDHAAIVKQLSSLEVVKNKDDDGTAIGYAIYKTAHMIAVTRQYAESLPQGIRPAYDIKSAVIVLVTDGFDSPNPADQSNLLRTIDPMQAAAFATEQKIKVYIINIDPAIATEQFAPHRHLLERVAQETGGKYYLINDTTSLAVIYQEIDSVEKTALPSLESLKFPIYPYLIGLALLFLLLSVVLETTWLRGVP